MKAELVIPVLNVSDLQASFAWFAELGWARGFAWEARPGGPPVFGSVRCEECEIFLCVDGQGGRGAHGVWLSIWVDDVDAAAEHCARAGVEVVRGPVDEPWHVREVHVRHPDGHVLRLSRAIPVG
jgi:catechol 2,3-dioxygenase-like lactoylglutathione lyase family enzyme